MDFTRKMQSYIEQVNSSLIEFIPEISTPEATIYKSMRYSLLAGGKRLRPVLCLAVCDMLKKSCIDVLPFACAIEMIHTYSLIHDDLPAMDNDDYRRGRLTNHKVFGEAIAVLAGDGLLNRAFEVMSEACLSEKFECKKAVKAMTYIAKSSGCSGMIGGQVVDLESEGLSENLSLERLQYMHRYKTGALIKAPVIAAAIISGATDSQIEKLEVYADSLGLAFQIKDDILDVEGDSNKLGKPVGSDIQNHKSTYVSILGIEKSKLLLEEITKRAIESLNCFDSENAFLVELSKYLLKREN